MTKQHWSLFDPFLVLKITPFQNKIICIYRRCAKLKSKIYHTVRTVSKSNRKNIERDIQFTYTQIHDCSLSSFRSLASIKKWRDYTSVIKPMVIYKAFSLLQKQYVHKWDDITISRSLLYTFLYITITST